MSFDVTTLALAKSYADQHGGGGGASTAGDFIIKMTVISDDDGNYTVASCDATVEQIDAAVAAEKRVVVISTDTANGAVFELPMLQGMKDNSYYFGMFLMGQMIVSFVEKIGENESEWQLFMTQIQSGDIGYSNDALPNIADVESALNELVSKSHTHANKDALDKLSVSNGKLQYNGEPIGGENTIYIPATVIWSDDSDIATIETSVTFEQMDTAYKLGQEQILKLFTDDSSEGAYLLPLVTANPGTAYYFGAINMQYSMSVVISSEGGYLNMNDLTPAPKEEIVNDVLAALPTWTGGSY